MKEESMPHTGARSFTSSLEAARTPGPRYGGAAARAHAQACPVFSRAIGREA
jgi:hypothetical protein